MALTFRRSNSPPAHAVQQAAAGSATGHGADAPPGRNNPPVPAVHLAAAGSASGHGAGTLAGRCSIPVPAESQGGAGCATGFRHRAQPSCNTTLTRAACLVADGFIDGRCSGGCADASASLFPWCAWPLLPPSSRTGTGSCAAAAARSEATALAMTGRTHQMMRAFFKSRLWLIAET